MLCACTYNDWLLRARAWACQFAHSRSQLGPAACTRPAVVGQFSSAAGCSVGRRRVDVSRPASPASGIDARGRPMLSMEVEVGARPPPSRPIPLPCPAHSALHSSGRRTPYSRPTSREGRGLAKRHGRTSVIGAPPSAARRPPAGRTQAKSPRSALGEGRGVLALSCAECWPPWAPAARSRRRALYVRVLMSTSGRPALICNLGQLCQQSLPHVDLSRTRWVFAPPSAPGTPSSPIKGAGQQKNRRAGGTGCGRGERLREGAR